jgi:hypothetical protein
MAFHPDKCNVLTISRNKTPVKFKYVATQEAKSLIGFTTDVVDVAFPFEVIADCYSHIVYLINPLD